MSEYELVESEYEEREPLEHGSIVEAVILSATEQDSFWDVDDKDPSKGKKREVSFKFEITEEGTYNGRWVWGSTPTFFDDNPRCKLRIWVQEAFGLDEIPIGFKFALDQLEGQPVRIHVAKSPKGRNYVTDVLRLEDPLDQEPF